MILKRKKATSIETRAAVMQRKNKRTNELVGSSFKILNQKIRMGNAAEDAFNATVQLYSTRECSSKKLLSLTLSLTSSLDEFARRGFLD